MTEDEPIASLREQGRYSETTLAIVAAWWERCRVFFAPRPLLELRSRDLAEWHQSLRWAPGPSGKMYSANTINQAVGALRLYYRWALAKGLIHEDPSKGLRTPRLPRQPWPRPSELETRRLLSLLSGDDAASVRDRALLGLISETALAFEVCSRLDLGHLQIDTGAIKASGRRGGVYCLSQGLTDDLERYLEHGRPTLAVLAAKGEQALFLNGQGRRMTSAVIRSRLRRYRARLSNP